MLLELLTRNSGLGEVCRVAKSLISCKMMHWLGFVSHLTITVKDTDCPAGKDDRSRRNSVDSSSIEYRQGETKKVAQPDSRGTSLGPAGVSASDSASNFPDHQAAHRIVTEPRYPFHK